MAIQSNFPNLRPSLSLDFANVKQLDPRITYTRASTATFYNGVTTAKAEQNLATYSQQFDNAAWLKENSSITADSTTAPDGTTTADSLVESSANGPHGTYTALLSVTTASTVTVSIYAKQNTKRYIVLGSTDGFANYPVLFDLQSGVVVGNATGYPAYSAPTSSSITSVGSSWYRLTVTLAINGAASSARVIAYLTDDSGSVSTGFSYTGNGTSSAYIWGAQLEQRSAVSAYTATTTQAITNYIPVLQTAASGVARFDNNPTTGESLGLLIEESRTNLILYSSQFDNANWTKSGSTITADTIVAPDGTLTGDKLVENTAATAQHYTYQLGKTITATSNTASVYLKAGERTSIYFVIYDGSNVGAYFNLTSGTITSNDSGVTSSITSVGNGWYRCVVTRTTSASANGGMSILPVVAGSTSYTGDGYSGFFMWGAQLEAGAFATSYIPTVASQVTRAADSASMTGTNFSSWYNAGQSTFYAEAMLRGISGGANDIFNASDNSFSNQIRFYQSSSSNLGFSIVNNGTVQAISYLSPTVSTGVSYRGAGACTTNDVASILNANTIDTDSVAVIPVVTVIRIGSGATGAVNYNGTIKKIAYYPLRVTNAQLQALTS